VGLNVDDNALSRTLDIELPRARDIFDDDIRPTTQPHYFVARHAPRIGQTLRVKDDEWSRGDMVVPTGCFDSGTHKDGGMIVFPGRKVNHGGCELFPYAR
jgi:hypothetical protein